MQELLDATLKQLGIKDNESDIYLACLAAPAGLFASQIINATKIRRTTADLMLRRLVERGFLRRQKAGGRFRYLAESPQALLQRQEHLTTQLRELIPFMQRLQPQDDRTEVKFFEGVAGIRAIYDDLFGTLRDEKRREVREILAISSGADVSELMKDYTEKVIERRIRLDIPIRILAPSSSRGVQGWQSDEKIDRAVRYFDAARFPFSISLYLYADKVALYSPARPIDGAIIRNRRIADSLKSFFAWVWGVAPST